MIGRVNAHFKISFTGSPLRRNVRTDSQPRKASPSNDRITFRMV